MRVYHHSQLAIFDIELKDQESAQVQETLYLKWFICDLYLTVH